MADLRSKRMRQRVADLETRIAAQHRVIDILWSIGRSTAFEEQVLLMQERVLATLRASRARAAHGGDIEAGHA